MHPYDQSSMADHGVQWEFPHRWSLASVSVLFGFPNKDFAPNIAGKSQDSKSGLYSPSSRLNVQATASLAVLMLGGTRRK